MDRIAGQTNQTEDLRSRSLNELMDALEADLGRLEVGGLERGVQVLLALDAIEARFKLLEAQDHPLQAEKAQYAFIVKRVQANAARILRSVGGAKRLAELRLQSNPDGEPGWWWRLDDWLKQGRILALRRWLTIAGIAMAVLLVMALVYRYFLAPDPQVVMVFNLQDSAANQISQGDFSAALLSVEQGLAIQPENESLLLLKGIALQGLGRQPEADAVWQAAEAAAGRREAFLLARAALWLSLGDARSALVDAGEVTALNPQSAEGMFYLAKAHEQLGEFVQAAAAYQSASSLSEQQGNAELNATIRVNLAMMLQGAGQFLGTNEATPAY